MTAIVVTYPEGRIDDQARAELAQSLTDAVLIVECGQVVPMDLRLPGGSISA